MQHLLEYLKNKITDETPLSCIVDIFEEICQIPLGEDWILFHTGTYTFSDKPQFLFSLMRQLPKQGEDKDEYHEIHMDVFFMPTEKNKNYHEASWWGMNGEKSVFAYIRGSEVFNAIKNDKHTSIDIYMHKY